MVSSATGSSETASSIASDASSGVSVSAAELDSVSPWAARSSASSSRFFASRSSGDGSVNSATNMMGSPADNSPLYSNGSPPGVTMTWNLVGSLLFRFWCFL